MKYFWKIKDDFKTSFIIYYVDLDIIFIDFDNLTSFLQFIEKKY
jgi:hypothetical protein